jgi:hypothetical protein
MVVKEHQGQPGGGGIELLLFGQQGVERLRVVDWKDRIEDERSRSAKLERGGGDLL